MRFIALVLMALSIPALAQTRTTQVLDAAPFDALTPAQMNPNALYYTDKVLTYADWTRQFPQEAQALNLYPGFTEPTVASLKYGIKQKIVEKLMIYVVRAKLVLNKAPGQVKLQNITQLDSIRKFDPEIQEQKIEPNQFMSAVVGKGQINNFQWCSKDLILRPARETDLAYTVPKTRSWCSDTAHSICVESCYLFNKGYYAAVMANNSLRDESKKEDYGIAFQSEIRTFDTEQQSGSPIPLKTLTGLPTAVRGGLEQNSFYFNQLFQYAKILAVLQDHPSDPTKTIVTAYFAIAIKKRTWDISGQVGEILGGRSKLFNTATGITAGLPVFTQGTLKSIATVIETTP